ncbi:MAG: hypothetical protein ABI321_05010 [Polyangia bacterium]
MTPRAVHHHRHWLWRIPLGIVAILVIVYFLIDAIVSFATQKGLDRLEGAAGHFQKCHVTIFHPGYDVYGLKIVSMPFSPKKEPLFYADKIEMRWSWKAIFHGHLVRDINIVKARAMIPLAPGREGKPAQPPLEIAKTLESVPSAGLDRLTVESSQIIIVDEHHDGQRLWLHHLDLTVENVASRRDLMHGLPLLVTARGTLQRSGALTLFLTIDPFDKGLTFAGSAEVKHLELADLYDWTKIKGLSITDGNMDTFLSVTCKRGVIEGGVKPVLRKVHVEASDGKLGDRIKAALADLGVKILSDRVPGRDAIASIIPIHGTLKSPKVEIVPAIMAVLRNAWVEGLSASLANTPPPVDPKDHGVLHQAVQALTKSSAKPIESHPNEGK